MLCKLIGYFGIDQAGCEAKGCCWVPTNVSHYTSTVHANTLLQHYMCMHT